MINDRYLHDYQNSLLYCYYFIQNLWDISLPLIEYQQFNMRKPSFPEFFAGLTNKQINHLLMISSSFCEKCSSHKKYVCISRECRKKSLVCGECNQNNIYYEHFHHQVVFLKEFLTKGKYLCLGRGLEEYEKYLQFIDESILKLRKAIDEMQELKIKVARHSEKLRNFIKQTGFFQFEKKLIKFRNNQSTRVKSPKDNLEAIFSNYKYVSPHQFSEYVGKIFKEERLFQCLKGIRDKIQAVKPKQQFQKQIYNCQFEPLSLSSLHTITDIGDKYNRIKNIQTDNFEYGNLQIGLRSLQKKKCKGENERDEIFSLLLNSLEKVRYLEVGFHLNYKKISQIFHSMPHLKSVRFHYFQPSSNEYPISHDEVQVMKISCEYLKEDQFMKLIFNVNKFPVLGDILIMNNCSNVIYNEVKKRKYNQIHIYQRQSNDHINSLFNVKILTLLSKYKFRYFYLSVEFNPTELQRFEQIQKYNPDMKIAKGKSNFPSLAFIFMAENLKYYKEKYFSVKIWHWIVRDFLF